MLIKNQCENFSVNILEKYIQYFSEMVTFVCLSKSSQHTLFGELGIEYTVKRFLIMKCWKVLQTPYVQDYF